MFLQNETENYVTGVKCLEKHKDIQGMPDVSLISLNCYLNKLITYGAISGKKLFSIFLCNMYSLKTDT